jgi:hypothetical protein
MALAEVLKEIYIHDYKECNAAFLEAAARFYTDSFLLFLARPLLDLDVFSTHPWFASYIIDT